MQPHRTFTPSSAKYYQTMSGSTRGAAAANSRRIKQRLANVLFSEQFSKQGKDSHRKLDFASYSYDDLRQAYIQKVQMLHPDKLQATKNNTTDLQHPYDATKWKDAQEISSWRVVEETMRKQKSRDLQDRFVDLKEAWDEYEKIAKLMKNKSDRDTQDNFTMFGVGCSFSDNPDEQRRRSEIMDQAGKGWFSAGQIGEAANEKSQPSSVGVEPGNWSRRIESDESESVDSQLTNTHKHRTLIDHLIVKKK